MSRLDSRYPELDLYLQGVRRRLNRRFLLGEALVAWMIAAPPCLLAALFFPGPRETSVGFCLAASLLLALLWAAVKFPRRLSLAQSASWLDQSRGTKGLYRAAVDALGHEVFAFPDEVILNQADRRKNDRPGVVLPWKRLLLRAVQALATILALAAVWVLLPPSFSMTGGPGGGSQSQQVAKAPEPALPEGRDSPQASAKDTAKRLFPEDRRLAALAEQALASGDPGALESLLNQAQGKEAPRTNAGQEKAPQRGRLRSEGSPGSSSQGESQNSPSGKEGPESTGPSSPGSEGVSPSHPGEQGASPSSPRNQQQSTPNGGGGSAGDSKNGRGPQGSTDEGGQKGAGSGGGAPGSDHSDQKLGTRGPLPGNNRRLQLAEKGVPGVFEYVLPETGAKVPLSKILADSRRSAEASIQQNAPPMEFEDSIRQYFLTLSQENKP